MTREEFMSETKKLQELYNKTLNDTQLSFWYDELSKYELSKYQRAIGEFVKNQRAFPSLSEMLTKIKSLREFTDVKEDAPRVPCKTCNGTGLVKYKKDIGDVSYDYLCKCYCENGKRLNLPLKEYKDVFYYRNAKDVSYIDYDISQIKF